MASYLVTGGCGFIGSHLADALVDAGGTKKPAKRAKGRKAARKTKKPRKNPWADLTPQQRLKRVNAIRKGRGLPVKRKL